MWFFLWIVPVIAPVLSVLPVLQIAPMSLAMTVHVTYTLPRYVLKRGPRPPRRIPLQFQRTHRCKSTFHTYTSVFMEK